MKRAIHYTLSEKSLESAGWLFSPSLGIMVREHETGRGGWDIEIEAYTNVGTANDPCWEANTDVSYPAVTTIGQAIVVEPRLGRVRDWVHGDTVEMI